MLDERQRERVRERDLLGLFDCLHPPSLHFLCLGKHLNLQAPAMVDMESKLAL